MSRYEMSRRSVLSLGLAATGGLALAACGGSTGNPGGSGAAGRATIPTYKQHPGTVNLDGMLTSTNPLGPPAYTKYPTPYQTVEQVPGKGEEVSIFSLVWGAPPPALDQNPYLKAMQEAQGVTFKYTYTPSDSYEQKLATMLAGGELPDLTWMKPRESAPTSQALAQGAFADISDLLGGDEVLKYPNLANIPTSAWERSMFKGRIMGVPRPLWLMNNFPIWRTDWIESAGLSVEAKSPAEVFEIMTAMSTNDRWAMGALDAVGWNAAGWMHSMFGVPPAWAVDDSGNFTIYFNTPEFEAALDYEVKSWAAGHFHPDALLNQNQGQTTTDLVRGGKIGIFTTGIYGWYGRDGSLDELLRNDPNAKSDAFIPPGNDGKPPVFYQGPGWYGMVGISSAAAKDKNRLETLLRVLDYQVAPFGSKEYTLLNFGIEGHNFKYGADGNPEDIKDTKPELNGKYFIQPTETGMFMTGRQERTKPVLEMVNKLLDNSAADPTFSLYSESWVTEGANLKNLSNDYHNQIVSGRMPMAEGLKKWRDEWSSAGGDKIRDEYKAAFQAK